MKRRSLMLFPLSGSYAHPPSHRRFSLYIFLHRVPLSHSLPPSISWPSPSYRQKSMIRLGLFNRFRRFLLFHPPSPLTSSSFRVSVPLRSILLRRSVSLSTLLHLSLSLCLSIPSFTFSISFSPLTHSF